MNHELTIREIQLVALEILATIAGICDRNGLSYFLTYGTLIGAIRHKGFIPWDDDVDIMMPRPDYEQLLLYFYEHKTEYPTIQLFEPEKCSDYPYMIARFSDRRYILDVENEKDYGIGVFIDVYPLDGLGDDYREAVRFARKGDILSTLCYQSTRMHYSPELATNRYKALKRIVKLPVFLLSKTIGKRALQRRLQDLTYKPYSTSKYVGCIVWLVGGEENVFPREWFKETVSVQFEQYSFKAPSEYDAFLRKGYGDYMLMPPETERIGHHNYKAFRL